MRLPPFLRVLLSATPLLIVGACCCKVRTNQSLAEYSGAYELQYDELLSELDSIMRRAAEERQKRPAASHVSDSEWSDAVDRRLGSQRRRLRKYYGPAFRHDIGTLRLTLEHDGTWQSSGTGTWAHVVHIRGDWHQSLDPAGVVLVVREYRAPPSQAFGPHGWESASDERTVQLVASGGRLLDAEAGLGFSVLMPRSGQGFMYVSAPLVFGRSSVGGAALHSAK